MSRLLGWLPALVVAALFPFETGRREVCQCVADRTRGAPPHDSAGEAG